MDDPLLLDGGAATVEVHPQAGGRIGQITIAGRDVLRGPRYAHLGWANWGWYPLLPWSNRLPGGELDVAGRRHQLPINWPDGSAIHGLAADVPWHVSEQSADTVRLEVELTESCYDVAATQHISCSPTAVAQSIEVLNRGATAVPAGIGIHPWFVVAPVRVAADEMWPGDDAIPTGPPQPVGPAEDLRAARLAPPMDRCFTGLTATSAEVGDLVLSWDGPIGHVVVYSAEPGWVCVEPVTMANNGFAMAAAGMPRTGVVTLRPDQSLRVDYRLSWRRRQT